MSTTTDTTSNPTQTVRYAARARLAENAKYAAEIMMLRQRVAMLKTFVKLTSTQPGEDERSSQ